MKINSYEELKNTLEHLELDKSDLNSMNDSVTITIKTKDGGEVLADVFFLSSGDISDFLIEYSKETKQAKESIKFLEKNFYLPDVEKISNHTVKQREIYFEYNLGDIKSIEVEKDFSCDEVSQILFYYSSKILGVLKKEEFILLDNNNLKYMLEDLEKYPLPKNKFSEEVILEFKKEDTKKSYIYNDEVLAAQKENEDLIYDGDLLKDFFTEIFENSEKLDEYENISEHKEKIKLD